MTDINKLIPDDFLEKGVNLHIPIDTTRKVAVDLGLAPTKQAFEDSMSGFTRSVDTLTTQVIKDLSTQFENHKGPIPAIKATVPLTEGMSLRLRMAESVPAGVATKAGEPVPRNDGSFTVSLEMSPGKEVVEARKTVLQARHQKHPSK